MSNLPILDSFYICPNCKSHLAISTATAECQKGHVFEVDHKGKYIKFSDANDNESDYSVSQAAEIHDRSLAWLLAVNGITEQDFRQDLLVSLNLRPGMKVLVTGVGTGNDLEAIAEKISPGGVIFALDFSEKMLLASIDRVGTLVERFGVSIYYSLADAISLPFSSDLFDAVYHFGGINLYSNIDEGVSEMDRVACDGARIVFGDEGLAEWLLKDDIGKILVTNNPLYRFSPPLKSLPASARNVSLSWVINNCYYLIAYTKSAKPIYIDLDRRHQGIRGGNLRTRYYGQLEGVDPDLKNHLYKLAKARGVSRVELLEEIIRAGINQDNQK
jgi:SAM-dependent methyltransferase